MSAAVAWMSDVAIDVSDVDALDAGVRAGLAADTPDLPPSRQPVEDMATLTAGMPPHHWWALVRVADAGRLLYSPAAPLEVWT